MHVYSYLRVSSKGQVDGDGPERQREAIAAFCAAHKLMRLGEFSEGISGTVEGMDRPEFSDMLERICCLAKNGIHVEAIVVERVDRLARDLMVSELLLAECRKRGVKVFSADQGALIDMSTNGGDPTRVLIRQIMGALSQWEKSCIVRKLKLARDRIKARTGRCEGNVPFGGRGREQEILHFVRTIWYSDPRPSYQGLANTLNLYGYRTRGGNPWSRGLVHDLVRKHVKQKGES